MAEDVGVWTTINGLQGDRASGFWIARVENDPREPPMAIAALRGLPKQGFIRMNLSRSMDATLGVRVDLVDKRGQRFSIWENFGMNYYRPSREVWLSLDDFHAYFWGRCAEDPRFHPSDIREIQLRFYFTKPADPVSVQLSLMSPRMHSDLGSHEVTKTRRKAE